MLKGFVLGSYGSKQHLSAIRKPPLHDIPGGIRRENQMGIEGMKVKRIFVDHNFGIQGAGFAILHSDRIYVHFQNLRKIDDQIGEAYDDLLQLLQVSRWFSPVSLKQSIDLGF